MAKAVKGAFKFVSKIALGVSGFLIKPVLRALTPPVPEVDHSQTLNFRADPNAGVPYVIGRTGTAGTYTYATVGEPKNRNILFYTILSGGGPIDSFESFSMNGTPVVFDGADTPESGPYRHLVWQRRQLGTTPQTYLQPPNTTDAAVLSEWDSTHATSGYAAAWYVLGADQNAYSNGVPDPLWVLKGVKAYDWRQDSTYPGGSGSQRADDESTWAWTENPAVHAVTWILGRYQNGKRVLGLGGTVDQIVMAKYNEWANVCDANGWKVGGVVYSTDTKWQVLKAICQAGGAYPTPLGAKVSVIFNAPRVSIATLTGADMEAEPTIVGTRSRRDRFNAAVPRFRSEANGWQVVPAAPLVVSEYVTADGGQRTKELEWPLVQDVDQATQLAAYGICNSRELGPLDFSLIPAWMGLEPGDCITINEPEYGLTSQKVVIVARNRAMSSFERSISCVTETDSKHAFCLGQTGTPPPAPTLSAVDTLPTPPDVGDWTVTLGYITGPGGTLPAVVIDGACTDPNAVEIIVEYRVTGSSGDWTSTSWPITTTHMEIIVAPGVTYDVRIRYRYARNTEDPTGNTGIGTVTTPDIDAGTVKGRDVAEEILDAMDDIDELFAETALLDAGLATVETRTTSLEASTSQGRPNVIQNSDFSGGLSHWTAAGTAGATWSPNINPSLGSILTASPIVSGAYLFQDQPWTAGVPGVLSAEGDWVTAGHYLGVQFLNAAKNLVLGSASLSTSSWTSRAQAPTGAAPVGTAWVRVILVGANTTGASASRLMFQTGSSATAWRSDGNTSDLYARVITSEGVLATVEGRVAAYWQIQVEAGSGQAFIRAQADGIVGDVIVVADRIGLYNIVDDEIIPVLAATGGNAYFPGSVYVGAASNLQIRGDLGRFQVTDASSVVRVKLGNLA